MAGFGRFEKTAVICSCLPKPDRKENEAEPSPPGRIECGANRSDAYTVAGAGAGDGKSLVSLTCRATGFRHYDNIGDDLNGIGHLLALVAVVVVTVLVARAIEPVGEEHRDDDPEDGADPEQEQPPLHLEGGIRTPRHARRINGGVIKGDSDRRLRHRTDRGQRD